DRRFRADGADRLPRWRGRRLWRDPARFHRTDRPRPGAVAAHRHRHRQSFRRAWLGHFCRPARFDAGRHGVWAGFCAGAGHDAPMDAMTRWIGGGTALVAVALGAALLAGHALEPEQPDPRQWLSAEDVVNDVLAEAPAEPEMAAAEPAVETPFVIKSILPIDGPIKYGEWHWDEARAPAEGELVMTVDLDARVISVFRDGHEIGAAAVLLGTDQHPTPLGVFPILQK